MNKCQLAKKITHGADKFTLGACHLVWNAVCTKSLNLHLVGMAVVQVLHWREPCV